jgi:hypothetical protein
MKYEDFSNEIKFQVGQRVHVELKEIPEKERNVTVGTITKIDVMFPRTPKMRKIFYTIRFDENYIKKEHVLISNIDHIRCTAGNLKII